jgi:hypothetical protein
MRNLGPNSWNRIPTEFTFSTTYFDFLDVILDSFDNFVLAVGAVGVFKFMAGHISDIDIPETFLFCDFVGLDQCRDGRRGKIFHKIHGLKPGKVNGNIGTDFL